MVENGNVHHIFNIGKPLAFIIRRQRNYHTLYVSLAILHWGKYGIPFYLNDKTTHRIDVGHSLNKTVSGQGFLF